VLHLCLSFLLVEVSPAVWDPTQSQLESECRSGYQALTENQPWERDLVEAIPWVLTLPSKNGVATAFQYAQV